ncbi:MAG TPA: prephenate dehydrogenase/arogenate dehydrogenase family protein [Candidatus Cybelea sp.]
MSKNIFGILGVGAIGGSIGLRARRNGAYVVGADSDPAALENARNLGAIDAIATTEELIRTADEYVIAAHLEPTLLELERLARTSKPMPALIMDVASVKVPVVSAAKGLQNFVATHPMAGTELSGVAAASAELFAGCAWAYVPSGDENLDARARAFIDSMGGVAIAMAAEEHDRAVAISSHVPQIVASCYASLLRADKGVAKRVCGPVARELVRISAMSFAMWRDTLRANAANIGPELRRLATQLEVAADAMARDDVDSLAQLFGNAHVSARAIES